MLAAVRKLGYLPDQNARSLRQRNGHAIGVVVGKSLSNSRYGRTVEGMLQEASDRGYRLSLCRNRIMPNGMRDYLAAYYQCNIDGVIFMGFYALVGVFVGDVTLRLIGAGSSA